MRVSASLFETSMRPNAACQGTIGVLKALDKQLRLQHMAERCGADSGERDKRPRGFTSSPWTPFFRNAMPVIWITRGAFLTV